jgi:hypothetical protein
MILLASGEDKAVFLERAGSSRSTVYAVATEIRNGLRGEKSFFGSVFQKTNCLPSCP